MRKAEPPPLARSDALPVGLRLILGEGLDHLEAHRDGVDAGDAEAIHQSRVALRRLRTALKLLGRHLDPVARDGFNDGLRQLGRVLGAARDWDVFVLETVPTIRDASPEQADALERLSGPAASKREAAHAALRATLEDRQTEAILHDLREWSSSAQAFARGSPIRQPIGGLSSSMLDRLHRTVCRRGRRLAEQDDVQRHALRKSLKSLRYGIEMLQSLYPHEQVKPYRRALNGLQEDLGRLNDAAAATELARRLPDGPGQKVIEDWADVRKRAALAELPETWRHFKAMEPFW